MLLGGGCGLVGGMIENYRKDSTRSTPAMYEGLAGKNYAVLVHAERSINAEYPELTMFVTRAITDRLSMSTNVPKAAGFVRADDVMRYQLRKTDWAAKPLPQLADELGADRVIIVDIFEFRLNEPGNRYEWSGVAAATVQVIEADGVLPEEYAFERNIEVKFPDQKGHGPDSIAQQVVQSALAARLIDRVSWLFYVHEEPYYPTY
jgi:hypothetical protein